MIPTSGAEAVLLQGLWWRLSTTDLLDDLLDTWGEHAETVVDMRPMSTADVRAELAAFSEGASLGGRFDSCRGRLAFNRSAGSRAAPRVLQREGGRCCRGRRDSSNGSAVDFIDVHLESLAPSLRWNLDAESIANHKAIGEHVDQIPRLDVVGGAVR